MLKCEKCGEAFDADDSGIYNSDGEMWACCPDCGSTDIAEAEECRECGEYFTDEEDYYNGLCRDCAEKAYTEALGVEFIEDNKCAADFKNSGMSLKNYCLYDMGEWIDFLIRTEEIGTEESNAGVNYVERIA